MRSISRWCVQHGGETALAVVAVVGIQARYPALMKKTKLTN